MYVKITNGTVDTYPYTVGQLRRDNPNTSFPKQVPDDMLADYGVMPVTFLATPSIDDRTEKVEQEGEPSLINDEWTVGWVNSPKTDEEIEAWGNNLSGINRSTRNTLLSQTDWTAMSDVTMSDDMINYRQALRDIPSHANFPQLLDADWPTKP
tara:strand:+ start:637 stop:1095 length:459 start_codon:yes stop_codon:yes gene_type:complete